MGYLIFLRLIHIVSGIFWAGATFYLAGFVMPAVTALGPDGGKFMQQLGKTNRLPLVMNIAGSLTVIGGILLIWEMSNGFEYDWFTTGSGMVFTTGGVLALIAYSIGISVNLPTLMKMNAIGKAIATAGAPPSAEQMQEMQKLRNRLFMATRVVAFLLMLTVIGMSIARYCNF
jgi:uncharacterized membrane protein